MVGKLKDKSKGKKQEGQEKDNPVDDMLTELKEVQCRGNQWEIFKKERQFVMKIAIHKMKAENLPLAKGVKFGWKKVYESRGMPCSLPREGRKISSGSY